MTHWSHYLFFFSIVATENLHKAMWKFQGILYKHLVWPGFNIFVFALGDYLTGCLDAEDGHTCLWVILKLVDQLDSLWRRDTAINPYITGLKQRGKNNNLCRNSQIMTEQINDPLQVHMKTLKNNNLNKGNIYFQQWGKCVTVCVCGKCIKFSKKNQCFCFCN